MLRHEWRVSAIAVLLSLLGLCGELHGFTLALVVQLAAQTIWLVHSVATTWAGACCRSQGSNTVPTNRSHQHALAPGRVFSGTTLKQLQSRPPRCAHSHCAPLHRHAERFERAGQSLGHRRRYTSCSSTSVLVMGQLQQHRQGQQQQTMQQSASAWKICSRQDRERRATQGQAVRGTGWNCCKPCLTGPAPELKEDGTLPPNCHSPPASWIQGATALPLNSRPGRCHLARAAGGSTRPFHLPSWVGSRRR